MDLNEIKLSLIMKEALALMDTNEEIADRIIDIITAEKIEISTRPNDEIGSEERQKLREAIRDNGGYCVCAIDKTPDTKCPCREFREDIVSGPCHCGLYKKTAKTEDNDYEA